MRLLPDWVERTRIRLEPRRLFHRARSHVVVVEQEASWSSKDVAQTGERRFAAAVYIASGHRVALVVRYPDARRPCARRTLMHCKT